MIAFMSRKREIDCVTCGYMYYGRAANVFSAGMKCWHCSIHTPYKGRISANKDNQNRSSVGDGDQ